MVYIHSIEPINREIELERMVGPGEDCLVTLPPEFDNQNRISTPGRTILGEFKKIYHGGLFLSNSIDVPILTEPEQLKTDFIEINQTNALINFYKDLQKKEFGTLEERDIPLEEFPGSTKIYLIQYREE